MVKNCKKKIVIKVQKDVEICIIKGLVQRYKIELYRANPDGKE